MKLPGKFPLKVKKPFGRKYSRNGFFVLDISDHSIKALHFIDNESSKLVIDGAAVREFANGSIQRSAVKSALSECRMQADSDTKRLMIGLSGSNIVGFILIVRKKREKVEKSISEKEMSTLYEKVKQTAYVQVQNRWSSLSPEDAKFVPLDLVVTSTKIDDKTVEEAVGEKGRYVQISVFCSYAEENYYNRILGLTKNLGCELFAVTTTMYSQAKLISETEPNYVLVDIGRDYTDIGVVLGENIVQTRSFNLGGAFFTNYLSDKMGIDYSLAKGKKEAYSLETLSDEESDEISDFLYEAGKIWRVAFRTVLLSMSGIKRFPEHIFLSGGGADLPVLKKLLLEERWRQSIPFAKNIELRIVSQDLWEGRISDKLNLLAGPRMFVPASIGVISLELSSNGEN